MQNFGWSILGILKFDFLEKGMELVSPPHFVKSFKLPDIDLDQRVSFS